MVIGLTGKSCSGKNYVGEILASKGLEVWDTDKMCHDGLNDNIRAIVSEFGEEVIRHSGGKEEVSRPALGKIVFSDPARRKALEDILYPWLGKKVEEWITDNPHGVLVLNGALLYRSGFCSLCNCVIYVDASYDVRLKRAMERDSLDEKTFLLREKSQQDVDFRDVRYPVPLYVVSNNDSNLDEVNRQISDICVKLDIVSSNA